jgi:hypothetical protein
VQKPKQILKDIALLQEAGFNVPEQLADYVQKQQDVIEDVRQVWKCWSNKCGKTYRSPVSLTAMGCECGSAMRVIEDYPR